MSTPARFSDGQYKNWLKCSHSLIIMKEALHDYIDNEVKKLHGNIILKVSSIPCGSSTGNQCGLCSWKDIKLTGGNPRSWSIKCKNSICDIWLHEILAVHDDPHNPTINWKNADISKWPIDSYEVAKIFMPKGQGKTTKMPDDLDAPAILSLMKYCNWFRTDLPNIHILSNLIDIRNMVLHSGDLRIADSDKDNWIDLMIQLLGDLNIPGDSQAELQELKREDIDINFWETEMRVFQRMVNDLMNELATLKEDTCSLQDSQSDLSKEMTELRDNTETSSKVDAIEADVKEIRKSLHELRNISDKMVSFLDKNPDILDIKVTETIRNVSRDVEDQQRNLSRVEKELAARLSALEMKVESIQEETKKQFEGVERGLDTIKGQFALQNSDTVQLPESTLCRKISISWCKKQSQKMRNLIPETSTSVLHSGEAITLSNFISTDVILSDLHANLTSLTIKNATLSEKTSRYLCESICDCSHLENLHLENITLHGVLDFGDMTSMISLTIKDVTLSVREG